MEDARRAVEAVARTSYGRLVAFLSAQAGDVAAAEDALGDALLAALATWPEKGVPSQPESWLITAARRRLVDEARHARVRADHSEALARLAEQTETADSPQLPDRRLELFFVCAHPAIDATVHTPLMLQTVLGLDAARIAQAFLVSPASMSQRLVRAKAKIRDARIPFSVPDDDELAARLDAVLEAIYAAFGLGQEESTGADAQSRELADEAIWLARALRQRMPDDPEVLGLLALMLFIDARRDARRTADGRFVPLSEQDVALWSGARIDEAEAELAAAQRRGRIGRFQIEAAIQSVHAERRTTGDTDWSAIAVFYAHLVRIAPTLGARVGRAVAVGEARGPAEGLQLLDDIDPAAAASYQPYWAVRAHLLQRAGRADEARAAFDRAAGLTQDDAVRGFLLGRRG